MKKIYEYVIWDWNGTILDDAWLCVDIVNALLRKRDLPEIDLDKYQDKFDFPVKSYYEKLGFDFAKEPFEIPVYEFVTEYNRRRSECELQEGAEGLISHLDNTGIAQFILSAYQQEELEKAVDHYNIRRFFKKIYGLDNYHADSKIAIGKKLMKRIGVQGGQVIFVGDTTHDYFVSEELGIDCILIPSGHQKKERLIGCGAKVVDKLNEIKHLTTQSSERADARR